MTNNKKINKLITDIKQNIQDENIETLKPLLEDLKEKLSLIKSNDNINV